MTYSTLRRTGPLRPRSEKRVKEDADFAPIRAAVFERDGRCLAPIAWGRCWGPWQPHHVISRARDHTLVLDPENLRTLCAGHHQYAHDHPLEATERGLLASPQSPEGKA